MAQTEQGNKARHPDPIMEPGDRVWLKRKNIRTTRPLNKLDHKQIRPYTILEKVGSHAYKLDLPASVKLHPVFHISLLEPTASTEPIPGHHQLPPPPIIIEAQQEWEVEQILDSQQHRSKIQYESRGPGSTTRTRPGTRLKTSKTPQKLFANSTRNTPKNQPPPISMSNTAIVDTNEGWTFTNVKQAELPMMTNNNDNWAIPDNATTTDGWNAPPPAPSPPVSAVGQPSANDHASLHWTACYDDYCNTHRQMKDDNYYPQRGNDRRRRNYRPCSCPHVHPFELAEVIRN